MKTQSFVSTVGNAMQILSRTIAAAPLAQAQGKITHMKKLLLTLTLGVAALTQMADAQSITSLTIVTATPETLALDAYWGNDGNLGEIKANYPQGVFYYPFCDDGGWLTAGYPGIYPGIVVGYDNTGGCPFGDLPAGPSYIEVQLDGFQGNYVGWSPSEGAVPSLVQPIAGRDGVHVVFGDASTELLNNLIAEVNGLAGVKSATKNALVVKLNAALKALSNDDTATACACVQDFIKLCLAQKSKKLIPASAADALIADATHIREVLGCP